MFKPVDPNPNFIDLEKKLLEHWYRDGIVKRYLHKNNGAKKNFSFQDGPITANNPMGVHHAWGRSYKDIWQKFYNLLGYKQRFQNGFDCQGLWVEVEVEKELGLKTKKDIENLVPGDREASVAKFVDLCKQRVVKFAGIQTEQSKRLGYLTDWDHSYFTMSDENNYMIWHFLKVCHENGWIYKGHESVPWCPRCETAISQHEMLTEDYKELVHESVYLKLKIKDQKSPTFQSESDQKHRTKISDVPVGVRSKASDKDQNAKLKNQYLLVWTTTPWTIPANIAVAVDKNIDYALVERENGEQIWLAKDAVERVFKSEKVKTIKTVKGDKLSGLKYGGPFDQINAVAKVAKNSPRTFHTVIITDERILPIMTAEGTGLVHTAVSAGVEDFQLGKKYGLPMIPVIADNADYLSGFDWLSGKNAKKHPEIIIDFLKSHANGEYLLYTERFKHRYPACWRCKTELVWKVADEWYIAMDLSPSQNQRSKIKDQKANKKNLRERMIEVAKKIKWMPEFGLERELEWLNNMHDWLISKKNRYWGLALPIYECSGDGGCGEFEVIGSKEELKMRAIAGWSEFAGHSPHKPFIDAVKIKCQHCGKTMRRIPDVGNPWLDAGIVEYSTITEKNQGKPLYLVDKEKWNQWFPANFITESFPGQFKNWFYAQIAMSTVLENKPPFEKVLGFATMMGEDGRPMHKSWGNYIDFDAGAEKIGVDVMRWVFAKQNPAENLLFGYKKADEARRQFYLMLWNIYKFFVEYANLDKFKVQSSKFKDTDQNSKTNIRRNSQNILDVWIKNRLTWLIDYAKERYVQYNVKDVADAVEKFVSDLSTWYIRRSRERVWVNSDDRLNKESFYLTLYDVILQLVIIISPILPFITDEIYVNLTKEDSVHLAIWPEDKTKYDQALDCDMNLVREIVETGHRERKELKLKVKQPLSAAEVCLPPIRKFLISNNIAAYSDLIRSELNVKTVAISSGKSETISVKYNTNLTPDLVKEGKLRELLRQIQATRKELQIKQDAAINLTVPFEFADRKAEIGKKTLAKDVKLGAKIVVSL